jgi:hypothetical protein
LYGRRDLSSPFRIFKIERVDASSADLDQDVTIARLRYGDIDFVDTVTFAVSLERKRLHRVSSLLVVDAGAQWDAHGDILSVLPTGFF